MSDETQDQDIIQQTIEWINEGWPPPLPDPNEMNRIRYLSIQKSKILIPTLRRATIYGQVFADLNTFPPKDLRIDLFSASTLLIPEFDRKFSSRPPGPNYRSRLIYAMVGGKLAEPYRTDSDPYPRSSSFVDKKKFENLPKNIDWITLCLTIDNLMAIFQFYKYILPKMDTISPSFLLSLSISETNFLTELTGFSTMVGKAERDNGPSSISKKVATARGRNARRREIREATINAFDRFNLRTDYEKNKNGTYKKFLKLAKAEGVSWGEGNRPPNKDTFFRYVNESLSQ